MIPALSAMDDDIPVNVDSPAADVDSPAAGVDSPAAVGKAVK